MAGIEVLASSDNFFYSENIDVYDEINHNIMMLLLENPRGLYYDAQYTARVPSYENIPNALTLYIGLKYDIASAVALYNQRVNDGSISGEDMRIAVSQNSIEINQSGQNVDVTVFYIAYRDTTKIRSTNFNIGVNPNGR